MNWKGIAYYFNEEFQVFKETDKVNHLYKPIRYDNLPNIVQQRINTKIEYNKVMEEFK